MTKMELQAYESCYTTVFLYLRLTLFGNGSGSVAHHKTFSGKQSFVDKKNGCELFRKELQEIMDNAVSTTKEATKFGMRLFNGYIDVRVCSGGYYDPPNENCIGNTASIKVDSVEKIVNPGRGYNVVVLNRGGGFIDSAVFDTFASSTADDDLGAYIDGLQENVIVLIAVADEATLGNSASEEDKMGANLQLLSLGAKHPRPSGYRASWALVGYKGPRDDVDWVRQVQAPAYEGPSEISVQIPKITGNCM